MVPITTWKRNRKSLRGCSISSFQCENSGSSAEHRRQYLSLCHLANSFSLITPINALDVSHSSAPFLFLPLTFYFGYACEMAPRSYSYCFSDDAFLRNAFRSSPRRLDFRNKSPPPLSPAVSSADSPTFASDRTHSIRPISE